MRLGKIISWVKQMGLCILVTKMMAKGHARYSDLWTRNQAINDWMKRSDKMDRTSGPTKSNQNVDLAPELVKDVVFIYGSSWGLYLLW